MDNFIITTDKNYNVISSDYGLNLYLIKLFENERYIVANVFDKNYFIVKRKLVVDDLVFYKFHFEQFKLFNISTTNHFDLALTAEAHKIIEVIGFFFLLGYQEDKELLQMFEKNKIDYSYYRVSYILKMVMLQLSISSRSQLRKILLKSQFNSTIPACLLQGIAHEKYLTTFLQ